LEVGIQENLRRLFPLFLGFFARKPLWLAHHKKKLIGTWLDMSQDWYFWITNFVNPWEDLVFLLDHTFYVKIVSEDDLGIPGITHFQRVECNRYLHWWELYPLLLSRGGGADW